MAVTSFSQPTRPIRMVAKTAVPNKILGGVPRSPGQCDTPRCSRPFRLRIKLPDLGAGLGVQRDDHLVLRRKIQDVVDHNGRGLEGASALFGVVDPGGLQLRDVRGVDLIQRRVSRSPRIAAIGRPVSLLWNRLRLRKRRRQCTNDQRDSQQLSFYERTVFVLVRRDSSPQARVSAPDTTVSDARFPYSGNYAAACPNRPRPDR